VSGTKKLVLNLRAKAPVWRIPERIERELADNAPPGWTVDIVGAETISDGDGGHGASPEALAAIADAEAYFGFGITPDLFETGKSLRWVHTSTAGVGSLLFDAMLASEVILTNSAGVHAIPMAEYVVAGLLHFWRGFDITTSLQRAGSWERNEFVEAASPVREAGENSVLIVGTGGIGAEVAIRLSALGAACTGLRRHPELGAPEGFQRVAGLDALEALLPSADALVLAAPLTPQTANLMTGARLDLLPRHAVVVNVARGAMIDESELSKRLASHRIRGAVLDVFQSEPLAPDSPLWQLRQALVTPHISAVTPRRFWDRESALFSENWRRYVAGTPLKNVVNKDAGY
jgi:phosphoglycerate dehydrogenase-like enzyme